MTEARVPLQPLRPRFEAGRRPFAQHVGPVARQFDLFFFPGSVRRREHLFFPRDDRIVHEFVFTGVRKRFQEEISHVDAAAQLFLLEKRDDRISMFVRNEAEQKRKKGRAIINVDDIWGKKLIQKLANTGIEVITYGMGATADFRAGNVKMDITGTQFELEAKGKKYLVRSPLIGAFNVYNAVAALAAAAKLGVELRSAIKALADAPSVPGRLQPVPVKRKFRVFVDYAHTDDALTNVLKTLRDLSPRRLIVVFGCGGDRDRAKRPLMAAAVERYADFAIVTSDNPRKESPEAIIEEIKTGFRGNNYEVVVDRRDAIYRAISLAQPRDIVLVAGKGHETYQEFADHTIPFDDLAVARAAVEAKPV